MGQQLYLTEHTVRNQLIDVSPASASHAAPSSALSTDHHESVLDIQGSFRGPSTHAC
jgi:hypothetical protein